MLYVANFSYTDEDADEDNYCLMPCIVEADGPEAALDSLADLLNALHEGGEVLAGASAVFLDSLVEMGRVPEGGLITQWQRIAPTDEGLSCVTAALPEVDEDDDGVMAYGFEGEDGAQEPFLVFDGE